MKLLLKILEGKKTYLGLLVAALPTIAGLLGYNVAVDGAQELGELFSNFIAEFEETLRAGGLLFAAYGRKVTKKD